MRCEWREVQIGDIVDFIVDNRGKTPPICNSGEYELIEVNAISSTHKLPRYSEVRKYIDKSTYQNWFRKGHPQPGDVLVPTVGTLGAVAYVNASRGSIAQNLVALRTSTQHCTGEFLYYTLCNPVTRRHLRNLDIGGVQPSIKVPHLLEMLILLPSLDEQLAIAATLSGLDDKIESNNKINANLEAQMQAIFDNWFKSDTSKEWPFGQLSDIAELNPKRQLSKGADAIYVEMSSLPTSGSFPHSWERKRFSGGMKFQNGDTLLARITPCLENGKTAYVNFLGDGEIAFGSTEYIVISSKPGYPKEMFYFLARNKDFVSYAVKNMVGTSGRQRVSADALSIFEMKIPPIEFVAKYTDMFTSTMKVIKHNSFENRTLAALRDALLPKLMSGEIEMPMEVN